ncbi:MAG: glycosyltransferase [Streptosporangiaceae bacterium]
MNIALVVPQAATTAPPATPEAAGLSDYAHGLGCALAELGHQVTIYARKDAPRLAARRSLAPGLTVRHLAAGPPGPLAPVDEPAQVAEFAGQLASQWRRCPPDVVHACSWTAGLAALIATRDQPVPIIQTFGSLAAAERRLTTAVPDLATRTRMEALVARNVTGVLAASSDEADELSRVGVPPSSVRVVPCGVDTARFTPRGRPDRRPDRLRLVQVGMTEPDGASAALVRLLAEVPGAELVLATGPGSRARTGAPLPAGLRRFAATLNLTSRVRVTSEDGQQGLPDLLRSADLVVSQPRLDPLGLSALRAMACGAPVAAIAAGGVADAVVDGTSGVLVPAGRPGQLIPRLRDLLAWPMKLTAFGIAAADRARSRYPWQRIAEEALAGYRDLAMLPGEPPRAA